jgi:3-deoxy-manno-octulosonate cytidylyltransferase (CMP-KDO synthetase)
VAIPARYGSTRLPGKPLRDIDGVPMVVRVAQRALQAGALQVVVAVDDPRIAEALASEGVDVCMTRNDHASGSDRLAECATRITGAIEGAGAWILDRRATDAGAVPAGYRYRSRPGASHPMVAKQRLRHHFR